MITGPANSLVRNDHADSAGSTAGGGSRSLRGRRSGSCRLFRWPDAGALNRAFHDRRRCRAFGRCSRRAVGRRRRRACGRWRRRRNDGGRHRRSWGSRGRSDLGLHHDGGICWRRTADRVLFDGSRSANNDGLLCAAADSGLRQGWTKRGRIKKGAHAQKNDRYHCSAFHKRVLSGKCGSRRLPLCSDLTMIDDRLH
jgi:hypothetical protein